MKTLASIMVATDFSVEGNNAVRRASQLAREQGAALRIVHVLKAAAAGWRLRRPFAPPDGALEADAAQARAALRRIADEITSAYGVTADIEVLIGDTRERLMLASERAQLVVIGHRGRSRLKAALLGATAQRLLRTCRRPVLVVKTPVAGSYRRALVLADLSPSSEAAIWVAAHWMRSAATHVFHAIGAQRQAMLRDIELPEPLIRASRQREQAGARARLRRQVARLGLDSTRMGLAAAHGTTVSSTLRHARWLDADLIVAGRRGRPNAGGFARESVSSRVLFASGCDTLIVPGSCNEFVVRATAPRPRLRAGAPGAAGLLAAVHGTGSPHAGGPRWSAG